MNLRQWASLGLVYLLGVAACMGLGLLAPLALDLRGAIHGSATNVGLLFGALYLPAFAGSALIGRLADRLDPRIIFVAGAAALAAPGALDLAANSLAWWIADICVMGTGLMMLVVTVQTVLGRAFSGKAQAGALSLWATAPYAGTTCGLLLSSTLAGTPAWRWVFLIQGLVALVIAIPAFLVLPARKGDAEAQSHHGAGGFRFWVREFKSIRVSLGYAVVTFCSAGSLAIWPIYLSRFHATPLATIGKLMAVTSPIAILGSLMVGALNARAVSPAKIGLTLAGCAVASTVIIYAPHIDLTLVAVAMALGHVAAGGATAFTNLLIPRTLTDQSYLGVSNGTMLQVSSIFAIAGVPAFFALQALSQANLLLAGLIIVSWVVMLAITPMWRLGNTGSQTSAPNAPETATAR